MVDIQEILRLPVEQQLAIVEAIQDNLDDFEKDVDLSHEHLTFIKERIHSIQTSNQPTYTWEQVQQNLRNRHNIQ